MMQPELLPPTWPNFNLSSSILDHKAPYDQETDLCVLDDSDFSYSSIISSSSYVPTVILDEFFDPKDSEIQIYSAMEGLETLSRGDIEDICEWINGDNIEANSSSHDLTMEGDGWSPSLSSESNQNSSLPQLESPMISLGDAMEVDDQITLIHLLRAYAEAMERGEKELAEVIKNSIKNKSVPIGDTNERVAYNLFLSIESQGEHMKESSKNYAAAFRNLYQSLPNGRFAHFTANSAILDSIPDDAGEIQIVDFDMGEGVQWPPLIEALSRRGKEKAVKLTSIRSEEEYTSCWDFDDTKKRLLSHAKQYGLRLQIEEKSFEDVTSELTEPMRMKKRSQERECLVFNCIIGLPHMGRRQPRRKVDGFLREAKALLANYEGILVLGDGEAIEDLDNCRHYASYFDNLMRHYRGVFESLARNFPVYLGEARAAIESLFLAPLMSPVSWFQDWEEMEKSRNLRTATGLGGRKFSLASLLEAKELVVEGEYSYNVKIEGTRENEMVLRWRETPLVRVSTWM